MKKLNKILSVGLSLALCASMVIPAFATNAYFYLEENGQYKFLGQGEMKQDVANTNSMSNEDMKDAVSAPVSENGTQTLTGDVRDGNLNVVGTQDVTVDTSTIDAFFGGAEYEGCAYDDGTSDVLGAEHTYTVTWKVSNSLTAEGKGAADAAVKDGEVVFTGTEGATKVDFEVGQDTVHFDGTVTKSTNTAVKVVVNNFGAGAAVENGDLYVRQGIVDAANAAVTTAINAIEAELNLESGYYDVNEAELKDGQFVKTYTERAVEVTYSVTNANGLPDTVKAQIEETLKQINDKQDQVGATTAADALTLADVLANIEVEDSGTYSFGAWTVIKDEATGSFSITTTYTFEEAVRELPPEIVEQIFPDYYFNLDTIDDPAVPLASGPVTRAEFIDYLWRHENEPASAGVCTFTDVEEDHEYFAALCWADENGVAEAYFGAEGHEDGTFEPDELVTVAAVREFLDNFADVFGTNAVAAADLTTLTGEEDEAVLNCDEVLAEFFGEEYTPAEAEDDIAA